MTKDISIGLLQACGMFGDNSRFRQHTLKCFRHAEEVAAGEEKQAHNNPTWGPYLKLCQDFTVCWLCDALVLMSVQNGPGDTRFHCGLCETNSN